ncbi:MAG: hypothetical protein U0841_08850 [Chloroflexia bacterium]
MTRAAFAAYWEAERQAVAQFGYPSTEELTERLEDGALYRVRIFRHARLEYPNPAPV